MGNLTPAHLSRPSHEHDKTSIVPSRDSTSDVTFLRFLMSFRPNPGPPQSLQPLQRTQHSKVLSSRRLHAGPVARPSRCPHNQGLAAARGDVTSDISLLPPAFRTRAPSTRQALQLPNCSSLGVVYPQITDPPQSSQHKPQCLARRGGRYYLLYLSSRFSTPFLFLCPRVHTSRYPDRRRGSTPRGGAAVGRVCQQHRRDQCGIVPGSHDLVLIGV